MNIIVKMHDRARVIETTRMDLHSGIMLEDDFLDISDYLNQGVLLERSVFITTSDDMQLLKRAVTLIEPDELDAIDGVYADGKPIRWKVENSWGTTGGVLGAVRRQRQLHGRPRPVPLRLL